MRAWVTDRKSGLVLWDNRIVLPPFMSVAGFVRGWITDRAGRVLWRSPGRDNAIHSRGESGMVDLWFGRQSWQHLDEGSAGARLTINSTSTQTLRDSQPPVGQANLVHPNQARIDWLFVDKSNRAYTPATLYLDNGTGAGGSSSHWMSYIASGWPAKRAADCYHIQWQLEIRNNALRNTTVAAMRELCRLIADESSNHLATSRFSLAARSSGAITGGSAVSFSGTPNVVPTHVAGTNEFELRCEGTLSRNATIGAVDIFLRAFDREGGSSAARLFHTHVINPAEQLQAGNTFVRTFEGTFTG